MGNSKGLLYYIINGDGWAFRDFNTIDCQDQCLWLSLKNTAVFFQAWYGRHFKKYKIVCFSELFLIKSKFNALHSKIWPYNTSTFLRKAASSSGLLEIHCKFVWHIEVILMILVGPRKISVGASVIKNDFYSFSLL